MNGNLISRLHELKVKLQNSCMVAEKISVKACWETDVFPLPLCQNMYKHQGRTSCKCVVGVQNISHCEKHEEEVHPNAIYPAYIF